MPIVLHQHLIMILKERGSAGNYVQEQQSAVLYIYINNQPSPEVVSFHFNYIWQTDHNLLACTPPKHWTNL